LALLFEFASHRTGQLHQSTLMLKAFSSNLSESFHYDKNVFQRWKK